MQKFITGRLKEETLSSHQELEKIIVGRLKKMKSTPEYIRLLSGFYGFIQPLENQIDKYVTTDILPDYGNRRKSILLLNDIKNLGYTFDREVSQLLPKVTDVKSAMGALYVLEGSTLGGQIIKKMLQKALDMPTDIGLSYFSGHGLETREYWTRFTEAINSMSLNESEQDAIIEQTNDTFEKFGQYLNLVYNEEKS